MRHQKAGLKLGRSSSHRDAMFRNMVTSLFKYERIQTTDAKAKELRRWADRVITLAKSGDLHSRRLALAIVRERDVVQKLFETAGERFGAISGGYTRLVKIGRRPGDAAPMTLIELVGPDSAPKKKKKKGKAPKASGPAVAPAPAPATEPEAPGAETTQAEARGSDMEAQATPATEPGAGPEGEEKKKTE